MSTRELQKSPVSVRALASTALAIVVLALLTLQYVGGVKSSGRTVGVYLEERDGLLYVDQVSMGTPADRAGLRGGDIVVTADGQVIRGAFDYDVVAESFERGRPVVLEVLRNGLPMVLTVVPGVAHDLLLYAANAIAALLHLILAIIVLSSRLRGLQAALLTLLLAAIAIEVALPLGTVGIPIIGVGAIAAYWLITGLEFSVELHLASLLPDRQPWLVRHSWVVPLFYVIGLGVGILLSASEVPALADHPAVAWLYSAAGMTAIQVWLILWPVAVIGLLLRATLTWPTSLGRQQVLLILIGLSPWAILTIVFNVLDLRNVPVPYWMEMAEPLVLVLYPLTVFVALFRYQLFNFELVVRRSAVYTGLTSSLVLVFYGALGAAGAFLSTFVPDPRASIWVIAGATLALGLLFGPLKSVVETLIERHFFPEREAQRRRLGALAHDLPRQGELPAISDALVTQLTEIFAADWTSVLLVEGKSGLLVSRASSGSGGEKSLAKPILLSATDVYVEGLRKANRSLALEPWKNRSHAARRFLELDVAQVHPIVADRDLVGLLLLGGKEGGLGYSAEEIELLDIVSHHVATVLENARLFESATTDGLTGLLRRESLLAELDDELERAIRYERPLTIGLVDVDQFKEINDRLGHLTGDVVLQQVARRFAEILRKTDILGRFGGDEFMIILPETELEGAAKLADQLRSEIERLEVSTEDGEVLTVTICVGLASVRELHDELAPSRNDLIRAADRQLYRAKQSGRNRVAAGAGLAV